MILPQQDTQIAHPNQSAGPTGTLGWPDSQTTTTHDYLIRTDLQILLPGLPPRPLHSGVPFGATSGPSEAMGTFPLQRLPGTIHSPSERLSQPGTGRTDRAATAILETD
jgi:hypothetical protein